MPDIQDDRAIVIAKINELCEQFHYSGVPKLADGASTQDILNALRASFRPTEREQEWPVVYVMIAKSPADAVETLARLLSLFSPTSPNESAPLFKESASLFDEVIAAAQSDNNLELLEKFNLPHGDKKSFTRKNQQAEVSANKESNDKESEQLYAVVQSNDRLFKLAKSRSQFSEGFVRVTSPGSYFKSEIENTIELFDQFTKPDFIGRTFLYRAAFHNTLEALITYFPSPHLFAALTKIDYAGKTPLHLMAELHPINNLARILKRLPSNEIRRKALLSLDSQGVSLLERCVLSGKSPIPLLLTLAPSERLKLLWQPLPGKDITFLEAIGSLLSKDTETQNLFNSIFAGFTAETAQTQLTTHILDNSEKWKMLFHRALDNNAFVVLDLLAFIFRELGQEKMLVTILNSLDENAMCLIEHSCKSAAKLEAVAALYPNEDSLVSALGSATVYNVTVLQHAFNNGIGATAMSVIPVGRRAQLLSSEVDPETGLVGHTQTAFANYVENLLASIDDSKEGIASFHKTLLPILASIPASDLAQVVKPLLRTLQLKLANFFKYDRWGNITLSDGKEFNRTECFVNAWHQLALEADQIPDQNKRHNSIKMALSLLPILFPAEALQKADHPRPEVEAAHLIHVLLTVTVISNAQLDTDYKHAIEAFLKVAENFSSVHNKNNKVDTATITSFVNLIRLLLKSPEQKHLTEILACPTSVTRQWFNQIREYETSETTRIECFKLIKQITAHFVWLSEQKLFPDDGVNYAIWVFCLQHTYKVKFSMVDQTKWMMSSDESGKATKFRELLKLKPREAKKKFPEQSIEDLNAFPKQSSARIAKSGNTANTLSTLDQIYEGDIESYRDQIEAGFEDGRSILQSVASGALYSGGNLERGYGSCEAAFAAVLREDGKGQTYLHRAAKHYRALENLLDQAEKNAALLHWMLTLLIQPDHEGKTPLMIYHEQKRLAEDPPPRHLADFIKWVKTDPDRYKVMTTANHRGISALAYCVENEISLLPMLAILSDDPRLPKYSRWSLLSSPMYENSKLTVFDALVAKKLNAGNQSPDAAIEEILSVVKLLNCNPIESEENNFQLQALMHCTVGNTTLFDDWVFGQGLNTVSNASRVKTIEFIIDLLITEITVNRNQEVVLPILKRLFESDSILLKSNAKLRDVFDTMVFAICFDMTDPQHDEMRRSIIAAVKASSFGEDESWQPVMSVLTILLTDSSTNAARQIESKISSSDEIAKKENSDLENVLKFLTDLLKDKGNLTHVLQIIKHLPETIRETVVQQLLAKEKDIGVQLIVECMRNLVSNDKASENHIFMPEITRYTENPNTDDKELILLCRVFQKLIHPDAHADLLSDDFASLPPAELLTQPVLLAWLKKISTCMPEETAAFSPVVFCFRSLVRLNSLSFQDRVLVLRKVATIFKATEYAFNEKENELFNMILMPLNKARVDFGNYTLTEHAALAKAAGGFFVETVVSNKQEETADTKSQWPTLPFFLKADARKKKGAKANEESDDEADELDASQSERGLKKKKDKGKERDDSDLAADYQKNL